jgi:aryl-alcohol dehydrogenase-like predicted oxidoreductase
MEYRNLGRSGLRVSLVGLGCNNFGMRLDVHETRAVVDKAIDCGITLFDTADVYGGRGGSEEQLAAILGPRRKDIVLATKFGLVMDDAGLKRGASRRYIMNAVEDSLRRLRTDWIDLYQQHTFDPRTPMEETLRALDDLVSQGKVRYVGCSNVPGWQVVEAHWIARTQGRVEFVSCQDEYNLLNRAVERELFPVMERYGPSLLPYFPLASGLLTGKYQRDAMPDGARLTVNPRFANREYVTERNWEIVAQLRRFAEERGISMLEVAFGWLAAKPVTASVIAGATSPAQIEANVAAIGWCPTEDDLEVLDAMSGPV